MACERFSDALKDHALGVALPSAAAAHLAVCSRCQAAFDRERRLHETMAGLIAQVGRVEPSADFQARLRRAAGEPSRVPTGLQTGVPMRRTWRYAALVPLGVAAALSVVVGAPTVWQLVWQRPAPAETNRAAGADIALAVAPSVATTSTAIVASREVTPVEPQVLRPTARRSSSPAGAAPASVLVAPGQIEAIGRLVARLRVDNPMMARQVGDVAGGPRPPAVALRTGRPGTLSAGVSGAVSSDVPLDAPAPIVISDVIVPAVVVSEPFSAQ